MKQYQYLFFDLDHTLWDFDTNARQTLAHLYEEYTLEAKGVTDFAQFYRQYMAHNDKLWERYRNGFIKVDELRWKRMWHTLLDFKIGDDKLARRMSDTFLELLPTRRAVFPHTIELLSYLRDKGYQLHLITNGFEKTQRSKLKYAGLDGFFGKMITSEGSNSLKPHREIFDYALQESGATAATSIMIGDNIEVDIIGASNAGIDQVFVNHLNEVPTFRPTYTVSNLKEMELIF
ncbi:YjjG family noncanonical pyrimidine nucleotidase [Flavihumibacter petaseus]|uniref:Putative 5'-nucleotidase n=1 Tax=Flavihumibacter petaseus NBRC 106054 TaxID=1220578 RepID=A0A0E9MYT3_9BACT|nr:YjjG family noncanonical pyrimidine nucleotidase [Flavihumibacter petaseus]GAO42872.1 putative 5'-nucleotidase [Flavihumibacter petaseus NBRC 106054]